MAVEFSSLTLAPGVYHTLMPGKTPGPGRVYSSLIVGTEKALLIDTGYGIGDYRSYVESLTGLPLIVANTHGHIDHASGNSQFGAAWLNPLDWELADWHTSLEMRLSSDGSRDYPQELVDGPWEKLALVPGTVFDLGGRTVTAYRCAGHTKGSMSFLDSQTGLLFTGDNITRRVLLLGSIHSTSLPEFRRTLEETEALNFRGIVAAHVPYIMPPEWVGRVKKLVDGFDPGKGKPAICLKMDIPGVLPLEYTVGRDFDNPEYCGFVFDGNHVDEFLERGASEKLSVAQ